jgi:4-amino-4-deoxy-L-arabinose transferase-like glycosyltransferase
MKKMLKKSWFPYFLLLLIIVLALVLRLYKINLPLADHHSWRQADTAAVARNFIKEGFDFFHPKIDNMTALAKPDLPNNQRLFMVEPPIYQTIVAGFYRLWGVQERWARLVSIIFYLGGMIFLYLLVEKLINKWVGLLTAFFMAVLPFGIFYGRVIMPEPEMIFASLGMLWFFWLWLERQKNGLFVWAVIFAAWALLMKTFPFFLVLPMFYLVWQKYHWSFFKQYKLWLLVFLAVLPLILWRFWISRFPAGIPPYDWLFNQGGIRFRPAFFRWIFAERIGKLILGYWGLPLLVLGLILRPGRKEGWFFHLWMISFLAYVTTFAAGNITHDYYQIPFIPIACIFLAKGSWFLLTTPRQIFNKAISYLLLAICFLFMIGFSWFEVRGFYLIQGGVDLAGRAVDEMTSKNALVLTGDSNDATLLYNTNRYGWTGGYASYFPNDQASIKKVMKMGGTVYVTTKFEEKSEFGQYMLKNYPVIKKTDQYIIFLLISNI